MNLRKLIWLIPLFVFGNKIQAQTDTFDIKLVGPDSVYWAVHIPYVDQGAIATKNSQRITYYSVDYVDADHLGIYFVIYNVTDTAAHLKSVKRYVEIIDTVSPIIFINIPGPIILKTSMTLDQMIATIGSVASATDNYDKSVIVKNNASSLPLKTPGNYVVTFDAVDTSNNKAIQQQRLIDYVLNDAVEELIDKTPFRIYPNPSSGQFQVHSISNKNIKEIQVVDALGRIAFQQSITSPRTTFDLNLTTNENGVYFVSMETEDGIFKSKLMLNK